MHHLQLSAACPHELVTAKKWNGIGTRIEINTDVTGIRQNVLDLADDQVFIAIFVPVVNEGAAIR
jgi:hypothetical protein